MKKKTLVKWEETNLDLDQYLGKEPCEIDDELYGYIWEYGPPAYDDGIFTQSYEAAGKVNDVFTFDTFSRINGKYFFLGTLPAFPKNGY